MFNCHLKFIYFSGSHSIVAIVQLRRFFGALLISLGIVFLLSIYGITCMIQFHTAVEFTKYQERQATALHRCTVLGTALMNSDVFTFGSMEAIREGVTSNNLEFLEAQSKYTFTQCFVIMASASKISGGNSLDLISSKIREIVEYRNCTNIAGNSTSAGLCVGLYDFDEIYLNAALIMKVILLYCPIWPNLFAGHTTISVCEIQSRILYIARL